MKKLVEAAFLILGTCGFFGLVYPELVLNDTNFVIECEQEKKKDQWTLLEELENVEVRFWVIEYFKKKED